jgi:hypothetical protein
MFGPTIVRRFVALEQLTVHNDISGRDSALARRCTTARRTRLIAAEGVVPNVIWLVLFGGGILTVSVTFSSTPRICGAQTLMTGLLALLIFSELTNVVIDRPFLRPGQGWTGGEERRTHGFRALTGAARVPKEHR